MSDWARKFTWGIVPSFLATLLFELLVANSVIPLRQEKLEAAGAWVLTLSVFRIPLLTLGLAIPFYLVVSYSVDLAQRGLARRREIHQKNRSGVYGFGSGPPGSVIWAGGIKKYGVWWSIAYGQSTGPTGFARGDPYTHVDGPRCPKCLTELLLRTVPRWVFLEEEVWRCPNCGEVVERPSDVKYEERRSVKKIADNEFQQLSANPTRFEESDPFDGRDDIITEVWNPE